jgi:predicted Zn-dependent peptidase
MLLPTTKIISSLKMRIWSSSEIKYKEVKPIVENFWFLEKRATPKPHTEPENVPFTQINFVDTPNAVQSEISLVNTLNLKMSDKDFFPAVATYILGGDFNSLLNMNLREEHGWTYGQYNHRRWQICFQAKVVFICKE